MKVNRFTSFAVAVLAGTLFSQSVFAAGYEKNIMWSGRFGGQGGAAVSVVQGSEALYFNPAGLVSDRIGQDVSVNVSPTTAQFEGPISADYVKSKSKSKVSVPFGVIYNNTLNEKMGFGGGIYVSGGTAATFDNVAFTGFTLTPDVKSYIQLIEVALGGAYRVTETLKVGASWRAGIASAEYASFLPSAGPPASLTGLQLNDLEDQQFNGFKVGAQWKPNDVWGLGFQWRSEFSFDLEGTSAGQVNVPGLAFTGDLTGGPVKVSSNFPMQAALGGHWNVVPDAWRAYAEYVWTQYSRNKNLVINGTMTRPAALGGTSFTLPNIEQRWKDQHNVRLAGEFLRTKWPVRFGYVWTSQVVPEGYARAAFSAPGDGHTFTIGTGKDFMDGALQFNTALEYSLISGDVATPATGTITRRGEYSTEGTSVHLGLAYLF